MLHFLACLLAAMVAEVSSHGMLLEPVSRAASAMVIDHTQQGVRMAGDCANTSCIWYTQSAYIPGDKATNCEPRMRTLGVHCGSKNPDDFPCIGPMKAPWCAPG